MVEVQCISHVRLFTWVQDWQRTTSFYADALRLPLIFTDEAAGVAMLRVGSVHLLIERVDKDDAEGSALVGRFAGISLRVGDIVEACSSLEASGAAIVARPARQPWGDTLAHVRDPAGNVITLLEFGTSERAGAEHG